MRLLKGDGHCCPRGGPCCGCLRGPVLQQDANGWAGRKVRLANWNKTEAGMGGCVDGQPLEPHTCCVLITWLKNQPEGRRFANKMPQGCFEKELVQDPQAEAFCPFHIMSITASEYRGLCLFYLLENPAGAHPICCL